MPPREIFRHTSSAAPEPGAWVSSIAIRTGDSAATARSASTPWTGSSHSSSPIGASARRFAERLLGRLPGAVGVDADQHVGPDRGADGGEPAGVVADADLDLHAAKPVAHRSRGRLGGARAVVGADRGVDGDLVGRERVDQLRQRRLRAARGVVPERHVDRRERLREVALGLAGGEHVRGRLDLGSGLPCRRRSRRSRSPARRRRTAPAARPRPRRRGRRGSSRRTRRVSRSCSSPQDARSGARSA